MKLRVLMSSNITPYNRIEHSKRERHKRDGQREGFRYIWNAVLTNIQIF